MNIKLHNLILICLFSTSVNAAINHNYAADFQNAQLQACDDVFKKLETSCPNMICRDVLVNAWAECWKKSMNIELNRRLLKLKKEEGIEFHNEIELQKSFNLATQNLCGKSCDSLGMKGISYNFCRIGAYKYRTRQALQINKNHLTIPRTLQLNVEKLHKDKVKNSYYYKNFLAQLCKMPNAVWKEKMPPTHCQQKALKELNSFAFTDDVCDLS